MPYHRLAVLLIGVLSAGGAAAAPVVLYDGAAAPDAEGWTRNAGAAGTVNVGLGATQFLTVNDSSQTSQLNTYAIATGASDFVASINLDVVSSSYNQYDAGLAFSAFGHPGIGVQNDRTNSLMIASGSVLWGDEGASATVPNFDAGGYHAYELRYLDGTLSFYFDADFADIVAGTATPLLTRTTVPTSGDSVGTIVFGDATNDYNYNSLYYVSSVTFQNLDLPTAAPEPAALGLLGAGAMGLALIRRRKARAVTSTGCPCCPAG